ncbi:MAG: hypothetical protein M1835_001846 [Candelina submexicana]|nr:MAG: hypothetical protein M1835_001846 [Candelina submexicana]
MTSVDPTTGRPMAADAIQRVLFVAAKVHVYNIPPPTSNKGYNASTWSDNNNARQIFTARLRILETAEPAPNGGETLQTDIVLEDPSNGALFAAAPYNDANAVEQALDSSRFFAVRVVGEGGRKAVLGVGFEERSDAFDFGVSLQEVRKVQGFDNDAPSGGRKHSVRGAVAEKAVEKKDFSLKEGETITVNLGGKARSRRDDGRSSSVSFRANTSFSIAPPPSASNGGIAMPLLPPPPSAQDVKAERRRSRQHFAPEPGLNADLGFNNGEFGEFQ